jgi:D-glycero-D-manno-heptose 1,7-bisphosphate phosphatase
MDAGVLIDRDGVIIKNRPNYIRSWQQVAIYPQAIRALVRLSASPYRVVIVTNQSGVGRGLVSLPVVEEINTRLVQAIETAGGRIDGVFTCPHAPQDG